MSTNKRSFVTMSVSPKVTHWQSPYMHAYFPALNSYPSLLGDMLADGINCLGFTWVGQKISSQVHCFVPQYNMTLYISRLQVPHAPSWKPS